MPAERGGDVKVVRTDNNGGGKTPELVGEQASDSGSCLSICDSKGGAEREGTSKEFGAVLYGDPTGAGRA